MNLKWTFQCFKHIYSEQPTVFIVAKDFTEIAVLREVFVTTTILLCNFYVVKYIKNLLATALITVELKNDLMSKFKTMMYARSNERHL